MKEIGGYFQFENLIKNEYYKELIPLNTGRNALIYILKAKNIKKVFIPKYICDSVINVLEREKFEFKFFDISQDFLPVFNKNLKQDECILIVNYFGQLSNKKIEELKEKYKNIIIDNTQAFFQKPINNVDTIYSCRKFFGVPDGAYVSTDKKLNVELEKDLSKERFKHLLGRYEGEASKYYSEFKINDKNFMGEPIKHMSKLTSNILGAINYSKIVEIRNENFKYLYRFLKKYNKLKLEVPEVAFSYPLYLDNGQEIREKLIKYKIYIPTLWPNVLEENKKDALEYKYSKNILPIPCDQRYTVEDMKFIIENIKMCLK